MHTYNVRINTAVNWGVYMLNCSLMNPGYFMSVYRVYRNSQSFNSCTWKQFGLMGFLHLINKGRKIDWNVKAVWWMMEPRIGKKLPGKYIITLWVFVFFWCKMAGKTDWTDHKMKIQKILYFYNYKRHNTHLPPPK